MDCLLPLHYKAPTSHNIYVRVSTEFLPRLTTDKAATTRLCHQARNPQTHRRRLAQPQHGPRHRAVDKLP